MEDDEGPVANHEMKPQPRIPEEEKQEEERLPTLEEYKEATREPGQYRFTMHWAQYDPISRPRNLVSRDALDHLSDLFEIDLATNKDIIQIDTGMMKGDLNAHQHKHSVHLDLASNSNAYTFWIDYIARKTGGLETLVNKLIAAQNPNYLMR